MTPTVSFELDRLQMGIGMALFFLMLVGCFCVWMYFHFDNRLEAARLQNRWMKRHIKSLQQRVEANEPILAVSIDHENPVFQPADPYPAASDDIFDFAPVKHSSQHPPATAELPITPYNIHIEAMRELHKLKTQYKDDTDYAEYLRHTMEETYVKLNDEEREAVEKEEGECWKYL